MGSPGQADVVRPPNGFQDVFLVELRRVVLLAAFLWPLAAIANDGAAAAAAGGIVLRSERRVAMESERLFVSIDRVRVEYEFVNRSPEEVVTEVAFPVPEYHWHPVFDGGKHASRYRFRAWLNGEEIPVQTEVRAFLKENGKPERDVTSRLLDAGVDITSFGEAGADPGALYGPKAFPVTAALPAATIKALQEEGLLGGGTEALWPRWDVRVTYHWTQRFPAGTTVWVAHEYHPQTGSQTGVLDRELDRACVEPALRTHLRERPNKGQRDPVVQWVNYILTTANTWKTPIGTFELTIEMPPSTAVSFCWDGKVENTGPNTVRAVETNFVPKRDLAVYFFPVKPTP